MIEGAFTYNRNMSSVGYLYSKYSSVAILKNALFEGESMINMML